MVVLALGAESMHRRGEGTRAVLRAGAARGLEVLGYAFAFRFWMFASGRFGAPWDLIRVDVLNCIGVASLLGGDLDEGEAFLKHAVELNPNDLGVHWELTGIAHIQIAQGRYEEALGFANRSLAANPGYDPTYWMLIAGNAYLGRMDAARVHVAGLQAISPGVTLSRIRRGQHARDQQRIDVVIEGMRLAGLPER